MDAELWLYFLTLIGVEGFGGGLSACGETFRDAGREREREREREEGEQSGGVVE